LGRYVDPMQRKASTSNKHPSVNAAQLLCQESNSLAQVLGDHRSDYITAFSTVQI
jgi:hypothetical protein